MNMRLNDEMKKKLKAVIEYLEYKEAPFQYALSEFNFLIVECADVIGMDRKLLATLVQNYFYEKLGMAFYTKQKELFELAGLKYSYNQLKAQKERKKSGTPKRGGVTPSSTFGKAFKEKFGFGSKGNMTLYQSCYAYYRQTGKYLWDTESWNEIKKKFDLKEDKDEV